MSSDNCFNQFIWRHLQVTCPIMNVLMTWIFLVKKVSQKCKLTANVYQVSSFVYLFELNSYTSKLCENTIQICWTQKRRSRTQSSLRRILDYTRNSTRLPHSERGYLEQYTSKPGPPPFMEKSISQNGMLASNQCLKFQDTKKNSICDVLRLYRVRTLNIFKDFPGLESNFCCFEHYKRDRYTFQS